MGKEFTLITRPVPQWVIDRFEEGWAVIENTATNETISIPCETIEKGAKPGDTIMKTKTRWIVCKAESKERAERISERFERIKGRGKK